MNNIPVTLIIKAPNQQYEDQTIRCELSWTIRKLKIFLSEVYPCKPSTDEQKLIYSGQLLSDTVILKDILRQYDEQLEGNQIHTVHLVFTPKNKPKLPTAKAVTSDRDGLRHRNVASSEGISAPSVATNNLLTNQQQNSFNQNRSQQNLININQNIPSSTCATNNNNIREAINFLNGGNSFNLPQLSHTEAIEALAQQMAMQNWLQQAYTQYLNQYMNFMQLGIPPEAMLVPQINQNIPMSSIYSQNPIVTNSSQNPSVSTNLSSPQVEALPTPTPIEQVQNQQIQDQNIENRPQPRFPNLVQEELPENRDWLDMFYTLSRLMIFLTLVYFYSSPMRCLTVVFIAVALYLYHIGFFRTNLPEPNNNRQPNQQVAANNNVEDNNNNNNNNNNNIDGANPQVPEQPENPNPNDNAEVIENNVVNNDVEENEIASGLLADENETRSIMSFIRTFVVSFFTSLVPETPGL